MVQKRINYAGVKYAHNVYVDSYVTAFLHIQYNTTYMLQLTTKVTIALLLSYIPQHISTKTCGLFSSTLAMHAE